jgi:hypothetical protein
MKTGLLDRSGRRILTTHHRLSNEAMVPFSSVGNTEP